MNKHTQSIGLIIVLGIIVIAAALFWIAIRGNRSEQMPQSNEVAVAESVPISTQSGQVTVNLIDGQNVTLPLVVTGSIPGNWFFEGSFPVIMKDAGGNQIGVALAQSSEDWMTTNSIPFSVTLPVTNYTGPGTITFKKDNPSGEAQFDDEVVVNVVY